MSKNKLRIGVIGTGFVGEKYVRIIYDDPLAELKAISDTNEDKAEKLSRQYNCTAYTDYNDLLTREDIDAVCICLPEILHKDAAIKAARSNKHILLEKPISTNHKDAVAIREECCKCGVRLMIAHILMFDARYVKLYEQVSNGELGNISHIFMRRQNTVRAASRFKGTLSFIHYLGIHDLALMLLYANSRPATVFASSNNVINSERNDLDNMYITIGFENGAVASLFIGWSLPDTTAITMINRCEIVGSKGMAVIDSSNAGYELTMSDSVKYIDTVHWPEFNDRIHGDLQLAVSHFIEATLSGKPYLVSTENAIEAVKVADHIFASLDKGKPVLFS